MKTSIKTKLYLYVGISIVLSTLISSGFFFAKYYSEIDNGINSRLTLGTQSAKSAVSADAVSAVHNPGFQETDTFKNTMKTLKEYEQSFGFKSVYLCLKEGDGFIFTYDSQNYPAPDASGDTFLKAYSDAPKELSDAWETGNPSMAEYTDQWGNFRSCFNPVKNSDGKVIAVMCADYEMSVVKKQLHSAYIFLGLILPSIILAFAVIYGLKVAILKPILQIITDIGTISAKKDLTHRVAVTGTDEISILAERFNGFMDVSSSIIHEIDTISLKLAASAEQLASISTGFTSTTQAQADNLSDVVTTVGSVTALINTTVQLSGEQLEIFISQRKLIGDLYSGILAVNGQAEKTLGLSTAVFSHAKDGEESLSTMNKSMDKVMESSNDMIGIIEIINDISDRINLLSLNAAIEAARAGDAGKGFAVVSEEISKLADQTASSTKNIDSLIKANSEEITREIDNLHATTAILKDIISGVEAMKIEVGTIQAATKEQLVTAEKVRSNAGNIYKRAEDIKQTADTQKGELDRISQSIGKIDEHTGAVITGSEEIAASSEDLAGSAAMLQEKISIFKL